MKRNAIKNKLFSAKNRRIAGVLGVVFLVMTLISGSTFAWFVSQDQKRNHMEAIQPGSVKVYEVFTPPEQWIPGQEVAKRAGAENQGREEVLVRISFEELLKKYSSAMVSNAAPLSGAQIPVIFDSAPYLNASSAPINGWSTPAALGLTLDASVTAGLGGAVSNLLAKRVVVTTDPATGLPLSAGYSFVFWYAIPSGTYAGQKQAAQAEFYVDGTVLKLKAGTVAYWSYPGRTTYQGAWANLQQPQLSPPLSRTPPAAGSEDKSILADHRIEFLYDQITTTLTGPVAGYQNKWFYNAEDGYFYFIGKLAPGATSPMLLKSVTLGAAADDSYQNLEYSLFVSVEAIQNYQTALTSSTGWNMASSAATTAIINAMISANAFRPI